MKRILIVDDEQVARESLERILSLEKFHVCTASDGFQALVELKRGDVSLMILDLSMPGMSGMQVLEHTQTISPETKVIIITAHGSMETAVQALRYRVCEYLTKPYEPDELLRQVRKLVGSPARAAESRAVKIIIFDEVNRKYWLRNQIEVDIERRKIININGTIHLTSAEARLLEAMLDRYGHVISHAELVKEVQGYSVDQLEAAKIIRPLMCRLRIKLNQIEGADEWVTNIRGQGYLFEIKALPA